MQANTTQARIGIIERFLVERLCERETVDAIVHQAIEAMLETKGSGAIKDILKSDVTRRRRLERVRHMVGLSPKQLSKVLRLQAALKMILNRQARSLTEIAYDSEYFDEAHFIRDFKEFTGTTPRKFLGDESMALATAIYK